MQISFKVHALNKPFLSFILFGFTAPLILLAAVPVLQQIHDTGVSADALPKHSIDTDQAFKIVSGPLKDSVIFFAARNVRKSTDVIPKFCIAQKGLISDSKEIPTIVSDWDIVAVQAVSSDASNDKDTALRILTFLTLEPMSGREEDYWDQPFVFDLKNNGQIDANQTLNLKLSKMRPRLKSIKELRAFLRRK